MSRLVFWGSLPNSLKRLDSSFTQELKDTSTNFPVERNFGGTTSVAEPDQIEPSLSFYIHAGIKFEISEIETTILIVISKVYIVLRKRGTHLFHMSVWN